MKLRERFLPPGWYPDSEQAVKRQMERWKDELGAAERTGISGIVPHAGWQFSGKLAFDVMRRMESDIDTLLVVGGHLPSGYGVVVAPEDAYSTPGGPLEADHELLKELRSMMKIQSDPEADNTVEVQLPLVKILLPQAKSLYLRSAPGGAALELGEAVSEAARKLGKKVGLIGSTDLTHYGPSYHFTPKGTGEEAVAWVKNENDKEIIDAFLTLDTARAQKKGQDDRAACSVGAAMAAMSFAQAEKIEGGRLLGYYSSYDIIQGSSFVGYAAILYEA